MTAGSFFWCIGNFFIAFCENYAIINMCALMKVRRPYDIILLHTIIF